MSELPLGVVPCPTECGRRRPAGKAMCSACWRRVPKDLQDALYRAWRQWSRDMGDAEKMTTYRQALDACVAEAGAR